MAWSLGGHIAYECSNAAVRTHQQLRQTHKAHACAYVCMYVLRMCWRIYTPLLIELQMTNVVYHRCCTLHFGLGLALTVYRYAASNKLLFTLILELIRKLMCSASANACLPDSMADATELMLKFSPSCAILIIIIANKSVRLVGQLVFKGTFSTNSLYRAVGV